MRLLAGLVLLALSLLPAALLVAVAVEPELHIFGFSLALAAPVLIGLWAVLTALGFAVLWPRSR